MHHGSFVGRMSREMEKEAELLLQRSASGSNVQVICAFSSCRDAKVPHAKYSRLV